MGRTTAGIAATLTVAAAALVLSVSPALASSSASLPDTVLKIRSLDWEPRTGSVAVTARVKCTGHGRYSWQASLRQKHAHAKGSIDVPCDGDGFLSTMVLDPREGRFHPGEAQFGHGSVTMTSDYGVGFYMIEQIRITAR